MIVLTKQRFIIVCMEPVTMVFTNVNDGSRIGETTPAHPEALQRLVEGLTLYSPSLVRSSSLPRVHGVKFVAGGRPPRHSIGVRIMHRTKFIVSPNRSRSFVFYWFDICSVVGVSCAEPAERASHSLFPIVVRRLKNFDDLGTGRPPR